tara:strand:- start:112 stop:627 length:516 start_codon:yes stop_codon:yes gene_type:complete
MILSCNSCEKKFVVPDNAIGANGRLVQCSSCGNKWKQFPINKEIKTKEKVSRIKSIPKKIQNLPKTTKRKIKRKIGPDLYSPEYLAKKHGIRIDSQPVSKNKKASGKTKVSFGFYSLVIVSVLITITILRLLYFAEDIIVERFPISEIYIDYLFESIRNIKEIIQNFFAGY